MPPTNISIDNNQKNMWHLKIIAYLYLRIWINIFDYEENNNITNGRCNNDSASCRTKHYTR